VDKGLLQIHASRPTLHGLEQHLVHIYDLVHKFKPAVVVVDPISNLAPRTDDVGLKLTLMRLIDFLKQAGVTAMFTSLTVDNRFRHRRVGSRRVLADGQLAAARPTWPTTASARARCRCSSPAAWRIPTRCASSSSATTASTWSMSTSPATAC
jgi:hypothetical protein